MGDKSGEELVKLAADSAAALKSLYPDLRDLHVLVMVAGQNGVASSFGPAERYKGWAQCCIVDMEIGVLQQALLQTSDPHAKRADEFRKRQSTN